MPSLKEILDDLEIKTDDLEKKEEKINLDEIPEAQKPIFKKLLDTVEELKTETARKDIIIGSLRDVATKIPRTEEKKTTSEEKILGVLDPNDPYAPAFQKLADMVGGLRQETAQDEEEKFRTNVMEFAKDHKDIVRYTKQMDKLMAKHPTLAGDIPTLYKLAKESSERRDGLSKEKKEELERSEKAERHRTETSGTAGNRVVDIVQSKNINDAFQAAEKQLARR